MIFQRLLVTCFLNVYFAGTTATGWSGGLYILISGYVNEKAIFKVSAVAEARRSAAVGVPGEKAGKIGVVRVWAKVSKGSTFIFGNTRIPYNILSD